MKHKYIYIRWLDASYCSDTSDPKNYDPNYYLESAGIFVKEDEKFIVTAVDFNEVDETYRHYHSIPKVLIQKRRWLR